MKTSLRADEDLVREGAASWQVDWPVVGGKLYLTTERLVFEAHALNFDTDGVEIPLESVTGTFPCWTKLLGLIPFVPNSVAVTTAEQEHRFVVYKRHEWVAAIQAQTGL